MRSYDQLPVRWNAHIW